ncbi:Type 1 glutamine amidotransferase-like domain-containing protein [Myroides odoratus]|uniref:Type 1 glutamine amidotransferase-like domain-containing protein n=1 Tax=Myroides odoratus TaxID=256 RepID=UPI0039B0C867
MIKLFLASSFSEVACLFQNFVKDELQNKSVTFIPTASKVEEYKGHVENDQQAFLDLGITIDVLELTTASREEIETKLAVNDFIFVSGGNTFYLLQEMRRSGADELIKAQLLQGKIYIGTSAGSVILSPNIQYLEAMDDKSKAPLLSNYNGLKLIEEYPLVHYQNFPFTETVELIYQTYKNQIPLVILSNNQVLIIENQTTRVISV